MFSGFLNLPWWGDLIARLILVQITIAGVTVYLHRCQAHRALDVHPIVSHFFRFWLWMTTGMITKEWAAIHRKHHAKCETEEDPHSPQILGINKVLFTGVVLYVKESHKPETMKRYGHGTPDDWMERNVYTPMNKWGIMLLLAIDIAALRPHPRRHHLRHPARLDPVLGRRRHQRPRPLVGLSQLRDRGCEHQHDPDRRVDRRRGAAQQPPRLPDLGQVLDPLVRVRPRLDVHQDHGIPGPRHGAQDRAQGEARSVQVRGRCRRRCKPSSRTATTCSRTTPSR